MSRGDDWIKALNGDDGDLTINSMGFGSFR